MIRSRKLTFISFLLISCCNIGFAQEIQIKPENMTRHELVEAIRNHEQLLMRYPNNEFTPRLLFQLSELFIRKAKMDYETSMEHFELKLKEFNEAKTTVEPQAPQINYIPAIVVMEKFLSSYPNSGFRDKIMYSLAICHQERGEEQKSINYFKRIIADFPVSNFYAEAYFRLGEYYFNKGNDKEAIQYYQSLVKPDMWSNPFFDMSLYKLGWSYYRLNQYPEAISAFMFLLKDIKTIERVQTQNLDLSAADLKKEAITYIAACFTEFSQPEQVFEFLDSFSDSTYKSEIISELADVYFQHNMLNEAITAYQHLNSEFPLNPVAPFNTQRIAEAYEKKWDFAVANIVRQKLIDLYNPESDWYAAQKDSITKDNTLKLVHQTLISKGVYHQRLAREKDKPLDYQQAIDQYKYFLKLFPQDSMAYNINYYLAESYYSIGKFEEAGAEYKNCYSNFPNKELNEKAAFNCVISYSKAIETNKPSETISFTLESFFDYDSLVTIQTKNSVAKEFILATHEYINLFPHSKQAVEVLMKEAEILKSLQYPQLARHIYTKIIKDYPDDSQKATAMTLVAQSFFQEENYSEAETWYKNVATTFSDSLEISTKAKVMMASSVFKIAENHKQNSEYGLAAKHYTKIALEYPDSKITETSLIEAGKMYEMDKDTVKSALLFETYIKLKPDSELLGIAALQAAKYREKLHQWQKAAENYLFVKTADSALWPAVVFSTADCYAKAGDWNSSVPIFHEYTEIGDDSSRILEAQFRIGYAHLQLDQLDEARSAFQGTIDQYRARKPGSNINAYFPANAQFMLAELELTEFSKIAISPPFKESLNKKTRALKIVLKAYTDAAKYRIFEWTTASSFKIGKVFEEFANAILVSSLPDNLANDEIISYESQLQTLARPFQKKALEAHQSNLNQAKKSNIENSWTTLSRERIAVLNNIINSEKKLDNP